MNRPARAFTLIELLVVIAIIGTIMTIVLASITVARNKGLDASVRQNLEGARSQAELFYDANGNNYVVTAGGTTDVCSATAGIGNVKGINGFVLAAANVQTIDTVTLNAAGTDTTAVCNSTSSGWAAQVPLKYGGFYCTDSVGVATTTSTTKLGSGSDTSCSS